MEDLYSTPPQQPISTPLPSPAPQVDGKSSRPMIWMIILAVLLLGAIGFGVWQWYEVSKKNTEISNLQAENTQLQSEVSSLEQQSETEEGATPAASETDKILAAVDAYTRAPIDASAKVFKYSITTNEGNFAKVKVDIEGAESYDLVLKKIDESWTVVISSQDTPAQADVDAYGIPASVYKV